MDSSFITLWIQGTSYGFKVYYPETNNLVYVHQREHCVCFLQAFTTSTWVILSHAHANQLPPCSIHDTTSQRKNNIASLMVDNLYIKSKVWFNFRLNNMPFTSQQFRTKWHIVSSFFFLIAGKLVLLQLPSSSFLVDVAINLAFECHHHMTKLYHYEILITGHHHTMFLSLP